MQMQIPPTTPQPLHSILLIAKTRSGPRLVAYYPPHPGAPRQRPHPARHDHNDRTPPASDSESDGSDSARDGVARGSSDNDGRSEAPYTDEDGEDEEDAIQHSGQGRASRNGDGYTDANVTRTARQHRSRGSVRSTLDSLPPYSVQGEERKAECLARLLAPSSRVWHKKRFEVAVEGVVFLGCPVFEKEGGRWGTRKGREKKDGGAKWEARPIVEEDGGDDDGDEDEKGVHEAGADALVDAGTATSPKPKRRNTGERPRGSQGSHSDNSPRLATRTPRHPDESPPLPSFDNSISSSSMQSSSTVGQNDNGTAPEPLNMFNVVFVLQPSQAAPGDYQATVQTFYTNIVKQFSKALAYQQKRHGFVWTETRLMTGMFSNFLSDKHDRNGHDPSAPVTSELESLYKMHWPQLAAKSRLAKAMERIYEHISRGEIAHVTLGTGLTLSLQIPLISRTVHAPTPMSPGTNGALWLTTFDASTSGSMQNNSNGANHAGDEDASSPTGTGISPYSALLLLQDGEALAREIAVQPTTELSTPLTRYIRHSVPTKTLVQLSRVMKFSLQDIQLLSLHLIHYRRAIAIPPLHASHTYIVSPSADFRNLPQASQEFGKRFAMLPSLVSILSKMSAMRMSAGSQGPQPWGLMIPSSDHKEPYMEILEWLMRGGWVTQLRTFGWVRVSAEVKTKVARQMKEEEREVAATEAAAALVSEEELDAEDGSEIGGEERRNSSGGSADGPLSTFSPRLRAHLALPRPPSDAGSTSTARTAVRISNLKPPSVKVGSGNEVASGRTSAASHEHRVSDGSARSRPGLETARDEEEPEAEMPDFEPSIVASPHKANAEESRWLEHIACTLPDEDIRNAWPRLVKYFDGKQAFEEIAPREGWKRKVVAPLLAKLMRQNGLLLTVRHW